MRYLRALNTAQRVVLVIAWGLVLNLLAMYTISLGRFDAGWIAYAGNSIYVPGLRPGLRLVVGVGFLLIWAAGSLVILRSPREP